MEFAFQNSIVFLEFHSLYEPWSQLQSFLITTKTIQNMNMLSVVISLDLSFIFEIEYAGITVKNFSNPWTLAGTQILQVWALFKSTS